MFERFTSGSRRVVVLALEEARLLRHSHLGIEHILLGILRQGTEPDPAAGPAAPMEPDAAARALASCGVTVEGARHELEPGPGPDPGPGSGYIPFTPPAKKTLELALRESVQLGSSLIEPAHLLLGLLAVPRSTAADLLGRLGADPEVLRERTVAGLRGAAGTGPGGAAGTGPGEAAGTGPPERAANEPPEDAAAAGPRERIVTGLREPTVAQATRVVPAAAGPPPAWLPGIRRALAEITARLSAIELRLAEDRLAAGPAGPEDPAEIALLRAEVTRLRDLLREHGIDPENVIPPA